EMRPAGDPPPGGGAGGARAGADAVILDGTEIPAGSLGLDERMEVPVLSVPERAARAAAALIKRGEDATVQIGTARSRPNPDVDGPAAFSSRGLAFDGGLKPELIAPGVALLTSHPGRGDD